MAFFENFGGLGIAILGAALSVLISCIGSAKGTGMVGEAAAALCSEDPSKFGKAMILQVLPGTQGLYGLVAWFLAVNKLGLLSGNVVMPTIAQGWQIFFACVPVIFGEILSAIAQAKVAIGGITILAKKGEDWSKGIILCVMVEFYAILCLLATFLMINGISL